MLHGRESLVRLVGKRRRAFFSPLARRLRSQDDSDSGEAKPIDSKEHEPLINGDRSRQARVAELVSCPVCDASVRGDDFSLNSHLDACLSKGKKRKLNQRTLLQVNFLSKSRRKTSLVEVGNVNLDKCEKDISEESQISNFHCSDALMLYRNDEKCESPSSEFGSGTSMLKVMDEDGVNGQTVDPHFPSGFSSTINALRNGFCQDKGKDVSTLETFIVGRRFHEKVDLQHGARVYTLREPKNPKDYNAIKVFFEDQGCRYPLGYLPRELAKYLSSLIDNHKLECEDDSDSGEAKPIDSKEHEPLINGDRSRQARVAELVSCPVCDASVRGDDFSLNSHLDACLSKGKKRKLNQRTLLQVNFLSKSRRKTSLVEVGNVNLDKCEKDISEESQISNFHCSDALMLYRNDERCESPSSEFGSGTSMLKVMDEDGVNGQTVDPHFPSGFSSTINALRNGFCQDKGKDVSTLETFIVGRRFHEKVDLQHGARVYTLREPKNPKDYNAIKVFFEDQGCRYPLGYLPRELAKYLSSLIDNHKLECEGLISSLPEHPLDPVPIILFCHNLADEIISQNQENFDSLWQKVLLANESAKALPTNMTKYQQNFCLMLEDVMDNHSHLFTSEEKNMIGSFSSLSGDAQRLLIRLYTRKGPWFRLSNIYYKEISDLNASVHALQMTGYLCSLSLGVQSLKYDDMKEVLNVLTVSELQHISNQGLFKNGIRHVRRQELIEYILSASKNRSCILQKMVFEHVGTCVKITSTVEAILWRIQRLFFLNGEQDLSAFLLVDIGLIKYPEYTCIVSKPIFSCHSDLLGYEEAIEVAQIMDESIDESNMETTIRCVGVSSDRMIANFSEQIQSSVSETQPGFFSYFSAWWVYSKVVSLGVSVYEREHRYHDAIRLLRELLNRIMYDSRRGYWALRLSIDLEHLGHFNESLSIAEKGVDDPWIRAGSKMALQRRVLRLGKPPRRWKTPSYAETVMRKIKEISIRGRPLKNEIGAKSLFYGTDNELCGVEKLALQYYAEEGGGWQGIHSESGIWMTIFGLLMWGVIFSDVPNVFCSKFQVAPLDLLTDDFYVVRKTEIESQLEKIHQGMAEEILITSWQLHEGTSCHGVSWDRFSLSDLRAAVSCVGGRCLASLCRHLAADYRSWSSGMPDLLLWRFHGNDIEGGEAKLVEVKGPRDRLSEQQRAWILTLMDYGIDAEALARAYLGL